MLQRFDAKNDTYILKSVTYGNIYVLRRSCGSAYTLHTGKKTHDLFTHVLGIKRNIYVDKVLVIAMN